jgi:hypothetical protein
MALIRIAGCAFTPSSHPTSEDLYTVRQFDEEEVDSKNVPFQALAQQEAMKEVHDGVQERDSLLEGQ